MGQVDLAGLDDSFGLSHFGWSHINQVLATSSIESIILVGSSGLSCQSSRQQAWISLDESECSPVSVELMVC